VAVGGVGSFGVVAVVPAPLDVDCALADNGEMQAATRQRESIHDVNLAGNVKVGLVRARVIIPPYKDAVIVAPAKFILLRLNMTS
jgi:hypothetical protein